MNDLGEGIENALVEAFAVFGKDPSFKVIRDRDHVRTYSGTDEAFLNNVFQLKAAGLTRERLEEIAKEFQGHPFVWRLGPSNGGLLATSRLLGECGYTHVGASPGMVMTGFQKWEVPELEIVAVKDLPTLKAWYDVWGRGFQMSEVGTNFCFDLFSNQKFYLDPKFALFLGKVNDQPVVCGNSYNDGDYTGLFNITVLREHRRKGYGAALTSHLTHRALNNSTPIYLFSSPEAFPLYKKLGFATACTLEPFCQL